MSFTGKNGPNGLPGVPGPPGVARETIEELERDLKAFRELSDRIYQNAKNITEAHRWSEKYSLYHGCMEHHRAQE
jgi:hypothetical protein